jgi:DNA end-binding protein Ku
LRRPKIAFLAMLLRGRVGAQLHTARNADHSLGLVVVARSGGLTIVGLRSAPLAQEAEGAGGRLNARRAELISAAIDSKRVIEIDEFVPKAEIDELYLRDPYFIIPDGEVGQQAFAVIREAIRKEGMVALGKVVFTSREHVIALEPRDKGMVGMTLRYPYEVRQSEEYFDAIDDEKVSKDMLDLAIHIVDTKRGKFEPEKFEDHYENALKELLRKKQKGEKIERPREPARTNVVNLMEALRQSVKAAGGKQSSATRAQAKKGKKRIEGQREMLLPIPGKKDKEAAAKSTARPSGRHRKAG